LSQAEALATTPSDNEFSAQQAALLEPVGPSFQEEMDALLGAAPSSSKSKVPVPSVVPQVVISRKRSLSSAFAKETQPSTHDSDEAEESDEDEPEGAPLSKRLRSQVRPLLTFFILLYNSNVLFRTPRNFLLCLLDGLVFPVHRRQPRARRKPPLPRRPSLLLPRYQNPLRNLESPSSWRVRFPQMRRTWCVVSSSYISFINFFFLQFTPPESEDDELEAEAPAPAKPAGGSSARRTGLPQYPRSLRNPDCEVVLISQHDVPDHALLDRLFREAVDFNQLEEDNNGEWVDPVHYCKVIVSFERSPGFTGEASIRKILPTRQNRKNSKQVCLLNQFLARLKFLKIFIYFIFFIRRRTSFSRMIPAGRLTRQCANLAKVFSLNKGILSTPCPI
jgi:hypothetical protein